MSRATMIRAGRSLLWCPGGIITPGPLAARGGGLMGQHGICFLFLLMAGATMHAVRAVQIETGLRFDQYAMGEIFCD